MFKPTEATTPGEYINQLDEPRKSQIEAIHNFIQETVPQFEPYIQSGMIGYGRYHYKYASGREGDWCVLALASQKNYISIYAPATETGEYIAAKYQERLPKASIGKSCIRFKKYQDIDWEALRALLLEAAELRPAGSN